jgi:hypothetical protein
MFGAGEGDAVSEDLIDVHFSRRDVLAPRSYLAQYLTRSAFRSCFLGSHGKISPKIIFIR